MEDSEFPFYEMAESLYAEMDDVGKLIDVYSPENFISTALPEYLDTKGPLLGERFKLEYLLGSVVKYLSWDFPVEGATFEYLIDVDYLNSSPGLEVAVIVSFGSVPSVIFRSTFDKEEFVFKCIEDFEDACEIIYSECEDNIDRLLGVVSDEGISWAETEDEKEDNKEDAQQEFVEFDTAEEEEGFTMQDVLEGRAGSEIKEGLNEEEEKEEYSDWESYI